jgi:hypothetical protein
MVELYSQIVVTRDLPEAGLVAGDVATVVEQYGGEEPSGYELEVFSASGETLDVVSVPADAVRPATAHDRLAVRIA